VTKTDGMRPSASRVIDAGNVAVRVIEIGKGCQAVSAESRDSYVEIVIETIEGVKFVCHLPVYACAEYVFIQRHSESFGELREVRSARELLAVLVVAFTFDVPEDPVLDQVTAYPAATLLPIERRFRGRRFGLVQAQIRCPTCIAEGHKT